MIRNQCQFVESLESFTKKGMGTIGVFGAGSEAPVLTGFCSPRILQFQTAAEHFRREPE
ncbi:hypothetical protein BDD14_3876 [Edaphobacter modestus]|uniref:Uncharacterized protein n=1 Tax=Edaphobacter modestus TaxID=388466 RepID=A0A4Q7YXX8_9BACT|nr:hypothetical protein BDD14_3876 [Edaphobacter modestus]